MKTAKNQLLSLLEVVDLIYNSPDQSQEALGSLLDSSTELDKGTKQGLLKLWVEEEETISSYRYYEVSGNPRLIGVDWKVTKSIMDKYQGLPKEKVAWVQFQVPDLS